MSASPPPQPSSFDFLERVNSRLALHADRALAQFADGDYNTCLIKLRQFGELLTELHERASRAQQHDRDASEKLERLKHARVLTAEQFQQLDKLRYLGNKAVHDGSGDQSKAMAAIRDAWDLAIWFFQLRTGDRSFSPGSIRLGRGSKVLRQELQRELERRDKAIEAEKRKREQAEARQSEHSMEVKKLETLASEQTKLRQSEKDSARSGLAKEKKAQIELERELKERREKEAELAQEFTALQGKLADVEQRMDELQAVPAEGPAPRIWQADWEEQYPQDWDEVSAFFESRLLECLPPFDKLADAENVGEGRWGRTWLCSQGGYGGPLKAVKIVRPPPESHVDAARSKQQWEREVERARRASRISHANVVRIDDFAPDSCPGFIIFEGLTGRTLADRLDGARSPRPRQVRTWLKQLASGLQTLWSEGVPFTDLHSQNVMIDSANDLKLFDVGFCIPTNYAPPEWWDVTELREDALDVRSNTYSMAIMALEMLLPVRERGWIRRLARPDDAVRSEDSLVFGDDDIKIDYPRLCRQLARSLKEQRSLAPHSEDIAQRLTDEFQRAFEPDPRHRLDPTAFAQATADALA